MRHPSVRFFGAVVCSFPLMGPSLLFAQHISRSAIEIHTEHSVPFALLASDNHTPTVFPTITSTITSTIPVPTEPTDTRLTLATAVRVTTKSDKSLDMLPTGTYEFRGKQLLQSAGTFSDLPRYLQTLPGVIGGSDAQNASSVRGGTLSKMPFSSTRLKYRA